MVNPPELFLMLTMSFNHIDHPFGIYPPLLLLMNSNHNDHMQSSQILQ